MRFLLESELQLRKVKVDDPHDAEVVVPKVNIPVTDGYGGHI
jgi:hypothetical protein